MVVRHLKVPEQAAELETYPPVACSLVCVYTGEAFVNQPGIFVPYKAACVTQREEVGSLLRESERVKDEGMAPHQNPPPQKKALQNGAQGVQHRNL